MKLKRRVVICLSYSRTGACYFLLQTFHYQVWMTGITVHSFYFLRNQFTGLISDDLWIYFLGCIVLPREDSQSSNRTDGWPHASLEPFTPRNLNRSKHERNDCGSSLRPTLPTGYGSPSVCKRVLDGHLTKAEPAKFSPFLEPLFWFRSELKRHCTRFSCNFELVLVIDNFHVVVVRI